MNPHPYFREQLAFDRRQTLTEQAEVHRLVKGSAAATEPTRRSLLRRWFGHRQRTVSLTHAGVPSTAPQPLSPR
jgi:hypothetical protein